MRLIRPYLLLALLLPLAACGLLREPEEASAPIEAVPLVLEPTTAPAEAPPVVTEAEEPAASPATSTETTTETATEAEPESPANSGELLIYAIDQNQSQVRFELGEDLRGQRTAVVGMTNQIAGELALNLSDLSSAQVGVIQINARTLATDNNFRNRAIHNEILHTGAYEFITFTPTGVQGLPAAVQAGDPVNFSIMGDLTIREITQPVTFNVTAMAVSAERIEGTATAAVNRADFDLRIPQVSSVANVDEQVQLTIEFVANSSS